jgi:hypothetical protein
MGSTRWVDPKFPRHRNYLKGNSMIKMTKKEVETKIRKVRKYRNRPEASDVVKEYSDMVLLRLEGYLEALTDWDLE